MNWKKFFKITFILFVLLLAGIAFFASRLDRQIYGGLTERVDPAPFARPAEAMVIRNVNVLSSDGSKFLPARNVYLDGGTIVRIDTLTVDPSAQQSIDGSGKFLIPGLIDAHVHLWQSPNDLLLYAANGVTGIRELIGSEDHLRWRDEIAAGRIGPKMFVASPRLGSFSTMEGWMMETTQRFLNVSDAESARALVRELDAAGYDGIKIYSHLNRECHEAVVATGRELGIPTFGHVPWELELGEVLSSGQRDVAHFEEVMNALAREFGGFLGRESEFLDYVHARADSVALAFLQNDVSITSTLWLTQSFVRQKFDLPQLLREIELPYLNPGMSEWVSYIPIGLGTLPEVNSYRLPEGLTEEERAGRQAFWQTYGDACAVLAKKFAERGVTMLVGTDANLPATVPGFSLHDELAALVEAGLSPAQVLRSATLEPARWMGWNTGKLEAGTRADLLLLAGNPLEDIRQTRNIEQVVLGGKLLKRADLDALLAAVREANDRSRTVREI